MGLSPENLERLFDPNEFIPEALNLISHGNTDYPASSNAFSHAVDVRMISAMRLVLASVALLVIYIDPSQPDRLVELTYFLLVLYTVYSGAIYVLSLVSPQSLPLSLLHWFDLAWYIGLIALSSGTNSIFFFFLFFAILVASFRWGFASGLRMTIAATLLFAIVGYVSAPPEPQFELNRFLLRPAYLLVLGYMIAYWGGSEVTLKRRLQFLKDITSLSNPRFGIDRTISWAMGQLRSFYDADACLLIQPAGRKSSSRLTRVSREGPESVTSPKQTIDAAARLLLSPSPDQAMIYGNHSLKVQQYDIGTGKISKESQSQAAAIADALDAKSFLSVPITYRGQPGGRLYILGSSRRLNHSDIEFVLQVIAHVTPLMDNIRLVDRLASDAADQERQKLARDIHDSVIQPYVGLQLGLTAVRTKLASGNGEVLKDIDELCELANNEVSELRLYLDRLKSDEFHDTVLLPAVRRFASKYSSATGIAVELRGTENIRLNDRLAAEAFQMVAEGLSNVRRHTNAQHAEIEITCEKGNLILRIINDNVDCAAKASFQPVSITERAVALGGRAQVYTDNDRTIVDVRIPLGPVNDDGHYLTRRNSNSHSRRPPVVSGGSADAHRSRTRHEGRRPGG